MILACLWLNLWAFFSSFLKLGLSKGIHDNYDGLHSIMYSSTFYRLSLHVRAQSLNRVWLCDPVDCGLPGSYTPGIFQARILEWVAIYSSRGSSWLRDQTHVSCIDRQILHHWATCGDLLWKELVCQSSDSTSYLCNQKHIVEPLWALVFLFLKQG